MHLQADGLGAGGQVFPCQRRRHIATLATKTVQDELVFKFLALQIGAGQREFAALGVGHAHASNQQQCADPLNSSLYCSGFHEHPCEVEKIFSIAHDPCQPCDKPLQT